MTVRPLQQKRGWAWSLAVPIFKPALLAASRREWIDGEKIPATGGCIIVLNHISHADPLMAAHIVYDHGRLPRYLAKSGLFRGRFLRWFLHSAGQIPVERMSSRAAGAFDAAVEAVRAGECVVVYPEGTITRDPDLWPMSAKSGAARIALQTGCPVVPIGQWGAHEVLAPYGRRLHLLPRRTVRMKVGDPVDLGDLVAGQDDPATVAVATERIMDALTAIVSELRGQAPPSERFNLRRSGVRQTGNPNKRRRHDEGKR